MEHIRFIKKGDMPILIQLCKEHAIYEESNFDETDKAKKLSQVLFETNSNLKCLVVELDNTIIGYSTFIKQFSTWDAKYYVYLDCLFLQKRTRGKGIGKKLMQKIKDFSIEENCSVIQWQTPTFNTKAIDFYKKLGAVSKTKERFIWEF